MEAPTEPGTGPDGRDRLARLDDPDPETRAQARVEVERMGAAGTDVFLRALRDGGEQARREAAMGLAETRAASALPALLIALDKEAYAVASWAARALGAIGDPQAVAPLIAKLADEEMRNPAAQALAEIGDSQAMDPLAAALAAVSDRFDYGAYLARFWLARALVRLGDRSEAAIGALKDVVDRDFGPETQQTWGSLRDGAVDLLVEVLGDGADGFLRPFLRRERETLQVRYRIARRYWLNGERAPEIRGTLERMARHPLYPTLSVEARDLIATEN